jgi:hypothetical protein
MAGGLGLLHSFTTCALCSRKIAGLEALTMKPVPHLTTRTDLWDVARLRNVGRDELRGVLGPPHHVETDESRTPGMLS